MKDNPSPYVEVAQREVCRDADHLEAFFQDVIDMGGEGVILRDPLAPLQEGRSPGFLKHKVNQYATSVCKLAKCRSHTEIPRRRSARRWFLGAASMGMRIVLRFPLMNYR